MKWKLVKIHFQSFLGRPLFWNPYCLPIGIFLYYFSFTFLLEWVHLFCNHAPNPSRADVVRAGCMHACVASMGVDDWLLCCRYVCRFPTGESNVSPLPVLGPFFFTGFLSQPGLVGSLCQSASARGHPQFGEELWVHHPSHPGVRGRQWRLYSAPHRLGKTSSLSSLLLFIPSQTGEWVSGLRQTWQQIYFILSWYLGPVPLSFRALSLDLYDTIEFSKKKSFCIVLSSFYIWLSALCTKLVERSKDNPISILLYSFVLVFFFSVCLFVCSWPPLKKKHKNYLRNILNFFKKT